MLHFNKNVTFAGRVLNNIPKKHQMSNKVYFENKEFDNEVVYNNNSYHSFKFVKCHFKKQVVFKNVILGSWVIFEDCIFDDTLYFGECSTSENVAEVCKNEIPNSLVITKCKIRELTINSSSNVNVFERGILIEKSIVTKRIHVEHVSCKMNGFALEDTTVNGNVMLSNVLIKSIGFRLSSSKILGKLRFQAVYSDSYIFLDSNIDENVYLWGAQVGHITFNNGIYGDEFNITAIKCDNLSIIGSEFKKMVRITKGDDANPQRGEMKNIYIKNSKFLEGLIIKSGVSNERQSSEKVQIVFSKELVGDIIFEEFDITGILLLKGFNYGANLQLNNTTVHRLRFDSFINSCSVIFQVFQSDGLKSAVEVVNSNLGDMSFLNTDLDSFEQIVIEGSVLTNIVTTNITWFNVKKLNPQSGKKNSLYWKKQREVFRQLKYSMEENKDRPQSLFFKSYEMDAYTKSLKFSQKSFSDILLLNLNKYSNKHGLSWPTGILFTFLAWQLCYASFVILQDGAAYPWESDCNWLLFDRSYWNTAVQYLWLPEGLDELSKFYGGTKPALNLIAGTFVFLLGKVAIAYGIFQAVSAFRKFGKA